MTSPAEQIHTLGDGKWDNVEVTVPSSGTELFFDFVNSGTDTSIAFYYNLRKHGANKVQLRPSSNVQIIEINGLTPKDPVTITAAGWTSKEGIQVLNMRIKTTAAGQAVRVLAW